MARSAETGPCRAQTLPTHSRSAPHAAHRGARPGVPGPGARPVHRLNFPAAPLDRKPVGFLVCLPPQTRDPFRVGGEGSDSCPRRQHRSQNA